MQYSRTEIIKYLRDVAHDDRLNIVGNDPADDVWRVSAEKFEQAAAMLEAIPDNEDPDA